VHPTRAPNGTPCKRVTYRGQEAPGTLVWVVVHPYLAGAYRRGMEPGTRLTLAYCSRTCAATAVSTRFALCPSMAIKFYQIEPGMTLLDIHSVAVGNSSLRQLGCWEVLVISVDKEQMRAMVKWNGNPPRLYFARELEKLYRVGKEPKRYRDQQARRLRSGGVQPAVAQVTPPHAHPSLLGDRELTPEERAAHDEDPRPGVWAGEHGADLCKLTQEETDGLIRSELALNAASKTERADVMRAIGSSGSWLVDPPATVQRGGIDSDPLVRLLAYRAWGNRDQRWFEADAVEQRAVALQKRVSL
jgi:hypothetical protein